MRASFVLALLLVTTAFGSGCFGDRGGGRRGGGDTDTPIVTADGGTGGGGGGDVDAGGGGGGGGGTEGGTCTHECAPGTAARCGGDGWQACVIGSDGCYRWGDVNSCPAGQFCEGGVCRGEGGMCTPSCDGTTCGGDGCGGTCACGAGLACADTGACCAPENGASACSRLIGALCERIVACCASRTDCGAWGSSVSECRAEYVRSGTDCSSPDWTTMTYCADGVDACVRAIPSITCDDAFAGTLPPACG